MNTTGRLLSANPSAMQTEACVLLDGTPMIGLHSSDRFLLAEGPCLRVCRTSRQQRVHSIVSGESRTPLMLQSDQVQTPSWHVEIWQKAAEFMRIHPAEQSIAKTSSAHQNRSQKLATSSTDQRFASEFHCTSACPRSHHSGKSSAARLPEIEAPSLTRKNSILLHSELGFGIGIIRVKFATTELRLVQRHHVAGHVFQNHALIPHTHRV